MSTLLSRPAKRKRRTKPPWVAVTIGAGTLGILTVIGIVVMVVRSLSTSDTATQVAASAANGPQTSLTAASSPSPLETELERLRAAGEPVTIEGLEAFYGRPPAHEDASQHWLAGIGELDSPKFKSRARGLPHVGGGSETIPWPGQPWPQLAAAEQFLSTYQTSLEAIHEAARRGGRARFDVQFAEGANVPLPHLDQLRFAIRLLALESAVAAHHRQVDGAVESVMAMLAAIHSLDQEPLIVSQLVRIALSGMAFQQIEWLLSAIALDDAQLARIDAEVSGLDYSEPLRRAFVGERVIGILGFKNPAVVLPSAQAQQWSRLPKSSEDEPTYLWLMSQMIAAAGENGMVRKEAAARAEAQLMKLARARNSKQRYPFTLLIATPIAACASAAARIEGGRDAARVAAAIARFVGKERRLPAKLDDLVPKFLGALPIDPCDGQQLRYRADLTDFVVYSVGPDGVDDGGRQIVSGESGDCVMRVRRKEIGQSRP